MNKNATPVTDTSAPVPEETDLQKKAAKRQRKKKRKKIIKWIILALVILLLAAFLLIRFGVIKLPSSRQAIAETYTTYTVSRRTIQQILTGTGTLMPNDSYSVTSLAGGEILEDFFEEGDEVAEDQLLMRIDSSNLESSLERAQNSYTNAKESLDDLYEQRDDLTVVSDYSGVIQTMNLDVDDEVNAGFAAAAVIDRDTMLIDVPFMQEDAFRINEGDTASLTVGDTLETLTGTVTEISAGYDVNANGVKTVDVTIAVPNPGALTENVSASARIGIFSCTGSGKFYYNVNEVVKTEAGGTVRSVLKKKGDRVEKGDVIAVLESKTLAKNIEKAERSLREASNALKDAEDAFDNYSIEAPISGTVIKKNFKKGEKIAGSGNNNIVAIIYDMSALKFDMNIDELDIDDIELGQAVNVTCDARDGYTYVGYVSQISVVGTTQNGTTYYPITITLDNYGSDEAGNELRPGMNIDAEIILKRSENTLAIPADALLRGNNVMLVSRAAERGDTVPADGEPLPGRPESGENAPSGSQDASEVPGNTEKTDTVSMPDMSGMPSRRETYGTVDKSTEYTTVSVKTGISDDDYVEILEGLDEGDVIIVNTQTRTATDPLTAMFRMSRMGGGTSGGMPSGMGGGMPSGGYSSGGYSGGMPGGSYGGGMR